MTLWGWEWTHPLPLLRENETMKQSAKQKCVVTGVGKQLKQAGRTVERGKRHLSFFNLISLVAKCIAFKRVRNFWLAIDIATFASRYAVTMLRWGKLSSRDIWTKGPYNEWYMLVVLLKLKVHLFWELPSCAPSPSLEAQNDFSFLKWFTASERDGDWFVTIYLILPGALCPGVYSASNRNNYQGQI
jgi:hypothetical protein